MRLLQRPLLASSANLNCRNPACKDVGHGSSDADEGDGVDGVLQVDEAAQMTGHVASPTTQRNSHVRQLGQWLWLSWQSGRRFKSSHWQIFIMDIFSVNF